MKESEREFVKKIGILIVGIIIGVVIDKAFLFTSSPDISEVETFQNRTSIEYVEKLPELEEIDMITEQEYGDWIGRNGICLDSCNGRECLNEKLIINFDELETVIVGWAADFNAVAPFKELYMKVGDRYIKCAYGEDRQSVVDYYQNEDLRFVGIDMTVPTDIFKDKDAQISFIGVGQDGKHIYKPVTYDVEYVE